MKQLLFTFILLFVSWNSFSQEEFSFTLYFEDAVGNKDSLILGYDEDGTQFLDEQFGEVDISNEPWDSVFEVRASEGISFGNSVGVTPPPSFQTKKQIVQRTCELDFSISINIVSLNYPIKLSWNSDVFQSDATCHANSVFTSNDWYAHDVGDGFFPFFLVQEFELFHPNQNSYQLDELNVQVYWLSFADINTPILNTEENNPLQSNLLAYPNPISSHENLTIEFSGNYSIINNVGQIVQDGKVENNQITMDKIPKGSYFIVLENGNQLYKLKIVKL